MDLKIFTTEELEEILNNTTEIKKEINNRKNKEVNSIKIKKGEVYYRDYGSVTCFYKITNVGSKLVGYTELVIDSSQIEWLDECEEIISSVKNTIKNGIWYKVQNSKIFDDMLKLCKEYNTECEKLHDKLYKDCKLIINNL